MTRYYSNVSMEMTLEVAVDIDDTTFNVDDASGLPTSYPFNVIIDPYLSTMEIVSVTNVIGTALTVVRGQEDTAAQNHSLGATLWHGATALDFQDMQTHYNASVNVHGVGATASVVGTDTVQTLTNKTMSGANNTFSNIPQSALGPFSNVTIDQTVATLPTLTLNRNVGATADVLSTNYVTISSSGRLNCATEPVSGQSQRWYNANFVSVVASMDNAGRLTCVGVTSTGSITASGQALTIGTVTASGLITANAGINVNTGQALTLAGTATLTVGGATQLNGSANINGATIFGSSGSVAFNNGFTVPSGETALIDGGGTLSVVGTLTMGSVGPSTLNLNGTINRDSQTARVLVFAGDAQLSADQASAGGVGSQTDLAGCTFSFTVPAGRTAVVAIRANVNLHGTSAGVQQGLACQLDGANQGRTPRTSIYTINIAHVLPGAWTFTAGAGAHTVKLQYINSSGTATVTYDAYGTSMNYEVFW